MNNDMINTFLCITTDAAPTITIFFTRGNHAPLLYNYMVPIVY